MQVSAGELSFEVDRQGPEDAPAVVMIAGLGFQLIDWNEAFFRPLLDAGYQIIRFDNRDIGLSSKFEAQGIPDFEKLLATKMAGQTPEVPYRISDMADDLAAILEGLQIPAAHIVGMSMGGMIAQIFTHKYPTKALSLTSIMSTSSDPSLPGPAPEAAAIMASAPQSQAIDDIVDFGLKVNDVIGSPKFRWHRSALEAHIRTCVERSYSPTGYLRQYAAILATPGRRETLKEIQNKTLVIHGTDDPLLQPVCGKDVAEYVPGAEYIEVTGMGHDLSPALCSRLAELVLPHLDGA